MARSGSSSSSVSSRSSRSRSSSLSSRPRSVSVERTVKSPRGGSGSGSDGSVASAASSRGSIRRKNRRKGAGKAANSDSSSDSEDESRSAAPPPPSRRKSRKSSSKNSQSSGDDEDKFDDGLDEDLIGDEDDRNKLENLTEREREEELFKRAENRENLKKRFEIQKKLKQQQKLRRTSPEGGDSAAEEDDEANFNIKDRSHDRRKNLDAQKYDKKSSALSELRAQRKEKEDRRKEFLENEQNEQSSQKKKKLKASEIYSDDSSSDSDSGPSNRRRERSRSSSSSSSSSRGRSSSSGGSDDTERFRNREIPSKKYIETQEDLEPIRLSRHKLERFVHLPFFKKTVVGCFVRIGIGQNNGKSVYRCVEIIDVCETAKIYTIGRERTNCGLRLKFGKVDRVFRLEFISNQTWTPTEFMKWKETCNEADISLPTHEFVKNKNAEIKKAIGYEFTSDDVDKIVAQKERFHRHPVNYAMNKARLMKEKEIALAEGQEEKAKELEKRLAELEERAEELDKRRTSTISTVSLINDRNRKDNVRKAEEAIREEINRKKLQGGEEANPFRRHKCNPRMVTKAKVGNEPMTSQQLLDLEKQKQEKENLAAEEKKKKEEAAAASASAAVIGEPPIKKQKKEVKKEKEKTDLFDAHNFDIEIDVDTSFGPSNPVNVNLKPVNLVQKDTGPTKRSLNLDDYKRRRGLI